MAWVYYIETPRNTSKYNFDILGICIVYSTMYILRPYIYMEYTWHILTIYHIGVLDVPSGGEARAAPSVISASSISDAESASKSGRGLPLRRGLLLRKTQAVTGILGITSTIYKASPPISTKLRTKLVRNKVSYSRKQLERAASQSNFLS